MRQHSPGFHCLPALADRGTLPPACPPDMGAALALSGPGACIPRGSLRRAALGRGSQGIHNPHRLDGARWAAAHAPTPRHAVLTLHKLEGAEQRRNAEEACDDPLRMIPYLLENKAVRGRVVRVDREHREMAERRTVRRPLVTLHSPDPCPIPLGRELGGLSSRMGGNSSFRRSLPRLTGVPW